MPETNVQIRQLCAADFDEAIELMNHAFFADASKDFRRLLPKLYRATDELMSCNYAAECDGGMKAIVGVFPLEWCVDEARLRIAGIGGVCTHPQFRGRGLMQKLMHHCVEEARTQGYDLSWLGGQRQRYAYFGYEKCGAPIRFHLNKTNIRHTSEHAAGLRFADLRFADLRFEVIHEHQGDRLRRAFELHSAQAIRAQRPEGELYHHLISWNSQPHAALIADQMVGYILIRPGGAISELVADDDETALQIACAWIKQADAEETSLTVGPLDGRMLSLFGDICEGTSVVFSGNWQVFDWVSVIDTLLKARLVRSFLVDGVVRLSIEGYGVLEIEVRGNEASCRLVEGSSMIECGALLAHRLLFGPLKPSQVIELPSATEALESWCPLPLYWAPQDSV